ncbi:hypothetical protein D9V34_05145 [Mycetocola lacteus]|uniref:Uncharacterized protein n=1 Tax=Mycetocola lacteus TaxID=76637 RepID=A0A3L7AVG8_9MICO|nr:hypothetical protein [Mycetocola lacteus]RLP84174.1 hypothetical protein D9V34_05145 [Mycetocola lacteus]
MSENATPESAENATLHARLAGLEAENARLRGSRSAGQRLRWIGAGVLLALGALLAPVAIVANWAATQTARTEVFVDTFEPLLAEPEVRSLIASEVSQAIIAAVNLPALTASAFDGLDELGVPERARTALNALQGVAVAGMNGLIERTVDEVIASPAFTQLTTGLLTHTHREVVAALSGTQNSLLALSRDGSLGVQLGPIVDAVKSRLLAEGVGIAAVIPTVDRTLVLVQADELARLRPGYALLQAAGAWLAPLGLLALLGGVLLAPRRRTAVLWGAGLLAGVLLLVVLALNIGVSVLAPSLGASMGSVPVAQLILETGTGFTRDLSITVAIIALLVGVIAWWTGPWRTPRTLRGASTALFARARSFGDQHGIGTGRFGRRLSLLAPKIRIVLALGAAAILIWGRPLTVGLVIWTLVGGLVVIILLELLRRPAEVVPAAEPDRDPLPA